MKDSTMVNIAYGLIAAMMIAFILGIVSVVLFSCTARSDSPRSPHGWGVKRLDDGPDRWENGEVVCYSMGSSQSGISCKWEERP